MSEKPVKQLIAGADSQTEFYPKQLMQNVLDGEAGENLYAYLSKFNHINAGYVASASAARNAIPEIYRKPGFIITYYINEKPTTEQFIGTKEDASNGNWVSNSYWQLVDGIGEVESNSITLNQLSKEVIDLLGKGNNKITNYPDGEDLTEIDACGGNGKHEINVLKFADKKYNSTNFSGLGRIYLRKNLVEIEQENRTKVTKNILTQEMINATNTRYIIQYDYDLGGETITVPEGCVLQFEGGSFNNGNLILKNSTIVGEGNISGVELIGTLLNPLSSKMFGFISDGETNNYLQLRSLLIAGNNLECDVDIERGNYYIRKVEDEDLLFKHSIDFHNSTIIWDSGNYPNFSITIRPNESQSLSEDDIEAIQEWFNSFDNTGNDYGGTTKIPNISENIKDALVSFGNNETEVVRRGQNTVFTKRELLYIGKLGDTDCSIWNKPFTISSGSYIKGNSGGYIKNLKLILIGNKYTESYSGYRHLGFDIYNVLNYNIRNIEINTDDIINDSYVYNNITITSGYNVTLKELIIGGNDNKATSSSYNIQCSNIVNFNIIDSTVGSLGGVSWGAFGCNYLYNIKVTNLTTNRFDVHWRLHSAIFDKCTFGTYGIYYSGKGIIRCTDCDFTDYALVGRNDYSAIFDGDIYINNCVYHPRLSGKEVNSCFIYLWHVPTFDSQIAGYDIVPVGANNVYIDNLLIDFSRGFYYGSRSVLNYTFATYGSSTINNESEVLTKYKYPNFYLNNVQIANYGNKTVRAFLRKANSTIFQYATHDDVGAELPNNIFSITNSNISTYQARLGTWDFFTNSDGTTKDLIPTSTSMKTKFIIKNHATPVFARSYWKYTWWEIHDSIISSFYRGDTTNQYYPYFRFYNCRIKPYTDGGAFGYFIPWQASTEQSYIPTICKDCVIDIPEGWENVEENDRPLILQTYLAPSSENGILAIYARHVGYTGVINYRKFDDCIVSNELFTELEKYWNLIENNTYEQYVGRDFDRTLGLLNDNTQNKGSYVNDGIIYNTDGTLMSKVVII